MGSKRNFWKGMFVGAGIMLIVCLFVGSVGVGALSLSGIFRPSIDNNKTENNDI